MPLVAHNELPTFERLKEAGQHILAPRPKAEPAFPELHIGLLNMMPDAALTATEQQFMRLVAASPQQTRFYIYPFSLKELNRDDRAEEHIARYYSTFDELVADGLDALIITGANVANPSLDQEAFWDPLIEVVRWAESHVSSILCSCLATHALLKHSHGIDRVRLPQKQWGVYRHEITESGHPLVNGIGGEFAAPHSRYNEITRAQLEDAGLVVLAESPEAGVHLAVSPDRCRVVYFQGHPEYHAVSLLKEYKREMLRFVAGELDAPPPYPENYLPDAAIAIADAYLKGCTKALAAGRTVPEFPERELTPFVRNTWTATGKAMVDNWLKLVGRLTGRDRKQQFADGIDPNRPLDSIAGI
ncbi:MAG: homoserine O-succinyltransferase [Woeseiaceae bacterium]|nr:homoserine O-succinyltransferase [Woeseiaceae bacterium]